MTAETERPSPPRAETAESGVAAEDYLKAVFKLEPGVETVSTSELASELDRSAASVTNMVKRLARRGKLDYEPYQGVRLTEEGRSAALRIIRRHRVIESYLIEELGYSWDDVHPEAERLEHAASDRLVDRMARALGNPRFDPHGAPIPSAKGDITRRKGIGLDELPEGECGVVLEVADEDAERLRYFASLGLFPGTELEVCSRAPGDGPLAVRIGDEVHALERRLAASVQVRPA